MLDAHPELAIPPETGFLLLGDRGDARPRGVADDDGGGDPRRAFFEAVMAYPPDAPGWQDFGIAPEQFWAALQGIEPFSAADGFRAFYRSYAARFGKPRWGDKTPLYCQHLETIAQLLPEAHFIHVIRDGRDVALSLRQTWFSPGQDIETLAAHWRDCIVTARHQAPRCPRYLEVRFEELIQDSERVLRTICAFLDLAYAPAMLDYHARAPLRLAEHRARTRADGSLVVSHECRLRQQALTMHPPQTTRAGVWRAEMNPDERQRFELVAGALLTELGY
jgi:hypothetical protein